MPFYSSLRSLSFPHSAVEGIVVDVALLTAIKTLKHADTEFDKLGAGGPAYISRCPHWKRSDYMFNLFIVGQTGSLFWHAHIFWSGATLYGPLIIPPTRKPDFPFPKPFKEVPIIFGEWWNVDPEAVIAEALQTGEGSNVRHQWTRLRLLRYCDAAFLIMAWVVQDGNLPHHRKLPHPPSDLKLLDFDQFSLLTLFP